MGKHRVTRSLAGWCLSCVLLIASGLFPMGSAVAQMPPVAPVSASAVVSPQEAAPVVVFNRTVVRLRASFLGMTPAERAHRAALNVEEALAQGGPGRVAVQVSPHGMLLMVDGVMAITLIEDDVEPMSGDTLSGLAQRTQKALQLSIGATQASRSFRHLLISTGLVALASALLLALWLGGRLLRRHVVQAAAQLIDVKTSALGGSAAELLRRDRLLAGLRWVVGALSWTLGLLAAYGWVSFSLQQFPYTQPWGEGLNQFLISVAVVVVKAVVDAVPGLVLAVVILLLAKGATGVLASLFTRIESGHLSVQWMTADSAGTTRRVLTWLIWLFAIAMAYPYLPGAQTEAFKGMSVLIGLMASIGASSFVGQLTGGLILTYTGMLRKGEYVRIGDHEGTVISIGAFNTCILTGLGEEVTLPNTMIVGAATKNYSRVVKGQGYVVDTVVTIGYDTPWRQVHAMLILAAGRTPGILQDPAPRVYQTALSDFYPEYRLVCQAVPTQPQSRAEVLASLHANIQDVFNENGVQIMSPHYVLDPADDKLVPPSRWYAPPAPPPVSSSNLRHDIKN